MNRVLLVVPLAAGALGALAACSGPPTPQTPPAKQAFCQSLSQLTTAVGTAQAVNATTTVAQAKDAAKAVEAAWTDTKKAAANLREAQANDLQQAYDEYQRTIASIPGSTTLGSAAAQVTAATTKLRTTAQTTASRVQCS
jgi:hypothetical protein